MRPTFDLPISGLVIKVALKSENDILIVVPAIRRFAVSQDGIADRFQIGT